MIQFPYDLSYYINEISTFLIFIFNRIDSINLNYAAIESISTAFAMIGTIILLFLTYLSLRETRKMVSEMQRQRESLENPAVSLRIVPDLRNLQILNMVIKNSGGGPAYDVSVKFNPDLPYEESSLNQLKYFQKIPLLDKNETIEFFFSSAIEYFKSDKPKFSVAQIEYYKTPITDRNEDKKPIIRRIELNINEREEHLYVGVRNLNDLVNEIEELKQGLLLIASNMEEMIRDRK
jgi:hypothetical protein